MFTKQDIQQMKEKIWKTRIYLHNILDDLKVMEKKLEKEDNDTTPMDERRI